MLKKTVTYTDYNGVERTEDFYFNLSKAEVTEMELSVDGGLAQMLENIVNSKDNKEIEIDQNFNDVINKALEDIKNSIKTGTVKLMDRRGLLENDKY